MAWSLSGCVLPLIRAEARGDAIGQTTGLLHLLWSLAMLGGTLLAGVLVVLGPSLPFWVAACLALPAALAAHRLRRGARRR